MGNITFLLVAVSTSFIAPKDKPSAVSATGDDGRIRITVSVSRDTIAPGEYAQVGATYEVLHDSPLLLPAENPKPQAFLYLKTPTGDVFVAHNSAQYRDLGASSYAKSVSHRSGAVMRCSIPLVDSSHFVRYDTIQGGRPFSWWRKADDRGREQPSLRREGVYEAWVKFTVPEIKDPPPGAWHGTITTDRVRFTVREIPAADRRAKATAEQIAHLEAYLMHSDMEIPGTTEKDAKPTPHPKADRVPELPKAVEMPRAMSLEDRLRWALQRTENEGLAQHMVEMLRKHQPKTVGTPYPRWWSGVCDLVRCRAQVVNPAPGFPFDPSVCSLAIRGPYLDEYIPLIVQLTEARGPSSVDEQNLVLLLAYFQRNPKSPAKQQLKDFALRNAKWSGATGIRNRRKLAFAWTTLIGLGVLHDGMSVAAAEEILGPITSGGGRTGVGWGPPDLGTAQGPLRLHGTLVKDKEGGGTVNFGQQSFR